MSSFEGKTVTVTTVVQPEIKNKKAIRILGIIEIIVAIICIVIGITVAALLSTSPSASLVSYRGSTQLISNTNAFGFYGNPQFNFGSGIWCGIWILISGALAVAAGGSGSSVCLVNCHIGFGVVGAILSLLLTASAAIISPLLLAAVLGVGPLATIAWLHVVLAVLGFIAFILLIISTSFGCCSSPNNCCACCCGMQQSAAYPGQPMQTFGQNSEADV
ncbi:uncharacterized protein LOC143462466 [Clavelina lepadiformis]|uniref:uncharacterized protein LOC143462466 n=1 Tax=Clavelina lepadiformis TaxID=159417 RepID=UPI00404268E6